MKRKVLLRNVIFFTTACVVPILFFVFVFYPFITQMQIEQIQESNREVVIRAEQNVREQLLGLYQIGYEVNRNTDIRTMRYNLQSYSDLGLQQEMRKHLGATQFAFDAFLYMKDRAYLYSPKGSFEVSIFSVKGQCPYYYEDWPHQDVLFALHNVRAPQLRPAEAIVIPDGHPVRVVTLLYPLPYGAKEPYGTLIYLMLEESFLSLMRMGQQWREAEGMVLDASGNIVACDNPQEDLSVLHQILKNQKDISGTAIVQQAGQNYLMSFCKSSFMDLTYVVLVPENEALAGMINFREQMLRIFLFLPLLAIVLIMVLSYISYSPFKRLIRLVHAQDADQVHPADEIEAIESFISRMMLQEDNLHGQLAMARSMAQEHLVRELLNGRYADAEAFNRAAKANGAYLQSDALMLMLLKLPDGKALLRDSVMDLCQTRIQDYLPQSSCYFTSGLHEVDVIAVISGTYEPKTLQEALMQLCDLLLTELNVAVRIDRLSPPCTVASAAYMLWQMLSSAEGNLHETNAYMHTTYPMQEVYALDMAVLKRDCEAIVRNKNKLVETLLEPGSPAMLIRTLTANILIILASGLARCGKGDLSALSDQYLHQSYTFSIPQQGVRWIHHCTDQLCQAIMAEDTMRERSDVSVDDMMHHIDQHYLDVNFSLREVADTFSMSISGFSHFFKAKTGKTFSQYLDFVRMEHAKRYLITTDDALSVISGKVGYADASSFIRAFRKVTGITPGEFREQHKHKR